MRIFQSEKGRDVTEEKTSRNHPAHLVLTSVVPVVEHVEILLAPDAVVAGAQARRTSPAELQGDALVDPEPVRPWMLQVWKVGSVSAQFRSVLFPAL